MAHKGELSQLSSLEFSELFKLMLQMIKLLKRVMRPQGFNVGLNLGHVAGAGAKGHLHIHIVPRWEADTNFMPVISDTKVVSQSLQQLYEQLVSPD
jgi:ATP adenylyltransferase